jgi:hypothetical protein
MTTARRNKNLEDMTPEEILAHTRSLETSVELFDTLLNDPVTRRDTLKALKSKKPNMTIPEIDTANEIETRIAAEREERQKLEVRVRDNEIRDRINAERKRVMNTHDLSEDQMLEVEKIMVDPTAPIPHYDAAAKVFKASLVQATPTSAVLVPRTFDMPNKDIWAGGVGSKPRLDKIALEQATAALNEIRGNKAA